MCVWDGVAGVHYGVSSLCKQPEPATALVLQRLGNSRWWPCFYCFTMQMQVCPFKKLTDVLKGMGVPGLGRLAPSFVE